MTKTNVSSDGSNQVFKVLQEHFQLKTKSFNKNEIILNPSADKNTMGIMSGGMAYLATINLNYQKRILDYYETNDIFCHQMILGLGSNSYSIYAKTKCSVAFLDYREFLKENNGALMKLHEGLIINSAIRNLQHIEILSQLTIRHKLLAYFDYRKKGNDTNTFVLPISLSELADYLAVDRSAMMRELGKMREEKLIMSAGRKITLLEG
ncbi:MAG: Crp/Fnr family transcriptional regulator [Mobilitalea sp.]